MKGLLNMVFYEAGLTPPMRPIAIKTSKLSFNRAAGIAI
jgi:hypothetical protein